MLYRMTAICRTQIAMKAGALSGELGTVLAFCMKRSVDRSMTGAMIWDSHHFMDVREGHPDELQAFWDIVREDPRNSFCQQLEFTEIADRDYQTLSIAAARPSVVSIALMNKLRTTRPTACDVRQHIERVRARGLLAESPVLDVMV